MHVENVIKIIITVFLIGLIILFVTFFTILGLTPTQRLGKAFQARNATSSEATIPIPAPAPETTPPSAEPSVISSPLVPGTVVYLNPSQAGETVTIEDGRMDVARFTARFGEQKELRFRSLDTTYTIEIPAYGLSQTVRPDETKLIAFQATQRGTFEITCGGCAAGFRATLTVE